MSKVKTRRPARPGTRMTIKDLAQKLGLSITTISRALNGYSDVGEATRQRVIEAARTTGYRPNRNARRLVMQRTHSFGWIRTDSEGLFADPHFVEVFAGVLRAAGQHNYDVTFAAERDKDQTELYDRYIREQSVDGFIIELPRPNDPRITLLLEAGVPFVVHGREARHTHYSWVDVDNRGLFRALVGAMIDSGHKRIAFINGDETYCYALERRIGVGEALAERDLPPETVRVLNSRHPMGMFGFQLTQQALEDKKATAILYSSSIMAVEGQAAIARSGRRAGRDIAVATMDDELRYVDLSPYANIFSFVRSSLHAAGQAIVEELVRQCESDPSPHGTMMPARFHMLPGLKTEGLPGTAAE
ncbi:MAG: LacI family DNA-binding transcriptional regulator [Cucumibacter sp.]